MEDDGNVLRFDMVVGTQVYIFVKTHLAVHLKWVHLLYCE